MKEEALKLANQLDGLNSCEPVIIKACEDMIRRLVEELDKQNPSVFTILTCGCKSSFMGFPSEWDGETREFEPCVNYGSLCEQHFMEYEARPAQYTPQTKPLSDEEILQGEPVVYWDGKHFASKEKSSLADIPLYTTPQINQCEPVGVVCEFEGALVGTLFESLPDGTKLYTAPQTKPLSDEEIIETVKNHFTGAIKLGIVLTNDNVLDFARAIEERHGIK